MQAMLFSAGLGTRLKPLTDNLPKALAPFGDTTLLGYNLKFLASQGISSFIINTHHFAGKIEEYLIKNNFFGLDIYISHEKELLDTGGGIAKVKNLFTEDQILLYNVDIVSGINIDKMYQYHCDKKVDISLAVRNRKTVRYLLFDENNIMTGWKNIKTGEIKLCDKETGYNKLAFSGISLLNKDVLNDIATVEKKSLIAFYLDICKERTIRAYIHDSELWIDCGTVEKLKKAEKLIYND